MEKIVAIRRFDKDKNGQQLTTSDGRNYTRVIIKVAGNENNISGFGNEDNALWNIGDDVDIVIEQKGQYWNFSMPRKSVSYKDFSELRSIVAAMQDDIKALQHSAKGAMYIPAKELQPDDDFKL